MRTLRAWLLRLGEPFRKERREQELADEMESHLALHIEDNLRAGMTPEEARRQAILKLGGVEQAKEHYRDRRSFVWLEVLLRDFRHVLRSLRKSPGYSLTCVAVLALGIGVNAAIFSVVYSVILKPLPYPEPEKLVFLWRQFPNMPYPIGERILVSRADYLVWKRQNTVFTDIAAFVAKDLNQTGVDHPRRVSTCFASTSLFRMLGAQPRTGRLFITDEEQPGKDHVAVLSHAYFEQVFHGNTNAVGRSIKLDGTSYTVIGILPAKFHLPATMEGLGQLKPDIWVPLSRLWSTPEDDHRLQLNVTAKLKPDVSLPQARTEMAGIAKRLGQTHPQQWGKPWSISVFPFSVEDTAPTLHQALRVLLAAVGLLLLIACANLANLTLARATQRTREVAVRLALGATRWRLTVQLLMESLVISLTGAAVGLLLAHWCIRIMLAFEPPDIQRPELIEINLPVFLFTAAAAILTTLLFGLAPALTGARIDLNTTLKTGGGWGASAARVRSRQFLIAAEVALAVILLAGAALMIRSFQNLVATGVGFDTQKLITVDLSLPQERYPDGKSQSRFFRTLIERAQSIPGATAAAVVDHLPLHSITAANFFIAGRPDPPANAPLVADMAFASSQYLRVLGMPLRAGRFFTDFDLVRGEEEKDTVAIVNEAFAQKFFPKEDPIGKRLLSQDKKRASEIVGVVADYRPLGVENGTRPQIFWPSLRIPSATLLVRTTGAPEPLTRAIQNTVWKVDKDLPADKVKTMNSYRDGWQSQRKFNTVLLAVFAGLALVLAMMGVYGVLSNLVASRMREIGIRMALGARSMEVGKLVLRQSMLPVMIGLLVGIAGTLALGRFLEALLFQVKARDPLTLALSAAAILLVCPLAIYVPLRRATGVDCTVVLREE